MITRITRSFNKRNSQKLDKFDDIFRCRRITKYSRRTRTADTEMTPLSNAADSGAERRIFEKKISRPRCADRIVRLGGLPLKKPVASATLWRVQMHVENVFNESPSSVAPPYGLVLTI